MSTPATAASAAPATPEASAQEVESSIDAANEEVEGMEEGSEEELEGDSEETTPEEKAQAKKELKKRLKYQLDGKEIEEEIDLENEELLRELVAKGRGADKRFQESAKMRKQLESWIKYAQENPMEAMKELGHDPDSLTESYMKKRVEEMQKSPEQMEMEKLRKELEERDKKLKQVEQEKFEAQQAKVQEAYSRKLDEDITSALSASDLPKSPLVVMRIVEGLAYLMEQGHENPEVGDVLPAVEKQIKKEIREMFQAMPEDVIEKVLGNDVSSKLRKRRLNKMKAAPETASSVKATGTKEINEAKAKDNADKKVIASKDFWSNFGTK